LEFLSGASGEQDPDLAHDPARLDRGRLRRKKLVRAESRFNGAAAGFAQAGTVGS
jgi:hypothetical protein